MKYVKKKKFSDFIYLILKEKFLQISVVENNICGQKSKGSNAISHTMKYQMIRKKVKRWANIRQKNKLKINIVMVRIWYDL